MLFKTLLSSIDLKTISGNSFRSSSYDMRRRIPSRFARGMVSRFSSNYSSLGLRAWISRFCYVL